MSSMRTTLARGTPVAASAGLMLTTLGGVKSPVVKLKLRSRASPLPARSRIPGSST